MKIAKHPIKYIEEVIWLIYELRLAMKLLSKPNTAKEHTQVASHGEITTLPLPLNYYNFQPTKLEKNQVND